MKLKRTTIDSFYKRDSADVSIDQGQDDPESLEDEIPNWLAENDEEEEEIVQPASKVRRVNCADNSVLNVERDPGLCDQIRNYPPDKQEQVFFRERGLRPVFH
jgi:hypothetical protein